MISSSLALAVAQSLLTQWFLFYEIPRSSLQDVLPALSTQVEILTPTQSAPLSGLSALIQAGATRRASEPSGGRNAHQILELNILNVSETQIEANAKIAYQRFQNDEKQTEAYLNYDLRLQLEGDRWRIRTLTASLAGATPSNITLLSADSVLVQNLEILRAANALIKANLFSNTEARNQLEAFIGRWYEIFDVRPPAEQLAPMISEERPVSITMLGTFTSREAFLANYTERRSIQMLNSHRVRHIDIRAVSADRATIDLYLDWQNQREGQPLVSLLMRNTMELARDSRDASWRVVGYTPSMLAF